MEKDSNFSAARGNGASSAKRSAASSKRFLDKASLAYRPTLQRTLENFPEARPEAVAWARKLIADPNYPPQYKQQILAHHLAVHLTAEIDQLPT